MQRGGDSPLPLLIAHSCRRTGFGSHGFNPDTPVIANRPACGCGLQQVAIVGATGFRLGRWHGWRWWRLQRGAGPCGWARGWLGFCCLNGGHGAERQRQAQHQAQHQAAGRPTPRAISVASRGMAAKPTNSMLRIQASRWASASLTWGSSPLRSGIAQRM